MTPDASVVVAAFSPWHADHARARHAIVGLDKLVAHAELEVYSVLTRLHPPHRVAASLAAAQLRRQFPGQRLKLAARARAGLVDRLAKAGIVGGAVYDALIAVTAREHDLQLLTCDRRTLRTYELVGADYVLI